MLTLDDFMQAVNDGSRELTKKHESQAVLIAKVGAELMRLLRTAIFNVKKERNEFGELLDTCGEFDALLTGTGDAELDVSVKDVRQRAFLSLTQLLYRRKKEKDVEHTRELSRERRMALETAKWLLDAGHRLPQRFGPEWIERTADTQFVELLQEFVFDLQADANDWQRFARLLPSAVRERFDPLRVGIPVPRHITSDDQARAIVEEFIRRTGTSDDQLRDTTYMHQMMKDWPALAKAIDYLGRKYPQINPDALPETPVDEQSL